MPKRPRAASSPLLPIPPLPDIIMEPIVRMALTEDLGAAGDVTTDALIATDIDGRWALIARRQGVVAGLDAAGLTAWFVDPDISLEIVAGDGASVNAGETIMEIEGAARSVLIAERVMLNFVGQLSGVATLTREYVDAVRGTKAQIAATRKTVPGLRALQKRAVRLGGGGAHRYGLDDAILIKDNHIAAAGSVGAAMERARAAGGHLMAIEIEVDSIDQLGEALKHAPDAVLLDNFALKDLPGAVKMVNGAAIVEVSGGVNLRTVRAIAEAGVDVISVGALTHSAPALDVGLDAI